MEIIEELSHLLGCDTVEEWRDQVFRMSRDLGYEQTVLAIFPDRLAPIEVEYAFLHSNYSSEWLSKYTANKFHDFDPTFSHCLNKSTPLIWSPDIFSAREQKEMYEEASSYGIRSGVTLPIHGARGEKGIVCFVNDAIPDKGFHRDAHRNLPYLSYFRDFVLESSLRFMKPEHGATVSLTDREFECLKWSASGKSSWEIGHILNCTEANVNYHFGNIRRKFKANTRQQAIARAINLGMINPG